MTYAIFEEAKASNEQLVMQDAGLQALPSPDALRKDLCKTEKF